MALSIRDRQSGTKADNSFGLPCAEITSLVHRVALAVLCRTDRAAAVTDEVVARFRSLPAGAGADSVPIDGTARIFIARTAYEAATAALATEPDEAADPGAAAEDGGQRLSLLASLTPRSRAVVVLRDVEGFELAQISRIVRGGESEIATELFLARRTLAAGVTGT